MSRFISWLSKRWEEFLKDFLENGFPLRAPDDGDE